MRRELSESFVQNVQIRFCLHCKNLFSYTGALKHSRLLVTKHSIVLSQLFSPDKVELYDRQIMEDIEQAIQIKNNRHWVLTQTRRCCMLRLDLSKNNSHFKPTLERKKEAPFPRSLARTKEPAVTLVTCPNLSSKTLVLKRNGTWLKIFVQPVLFKWCQFRKHFPRSWKHFQDFLWIRRCSENTNDEIEGRHVRLQTTVIALMFEQEAKQQDSRLFETRDGVHHSRMWKCGKKDIRQLWFLSKAVVERSWQGSFAMQTVHGTVPLLFDFCRHRPVSKRTLHLVYNEIYIWHCDLWTALVHYKVRPLLWRGFGPFHFQQSQRQECTVWKAHFYFNGRRIKHGWEVSRHDNQFQKACWTVL